MTPIDLHNEPAIAAFALSGNGGLVITSGAPSVRYRDLIIRLAAEHRLPAIYYASAFVARGGLISYGAERIDQFRRAADYVDRVLRGEKPASLPVQTPTQVELVINRRAAEVLGLTVSPTLLSRADEVIE